MEFEDESRLDNVQDSPERRGSEWGSAALLGKTKEFFQTCDVEDKGFITRTDMRRLHKELPLSAEELEDVFDSLDTDRAGYLTLEAFSSRFSQFLHGRRISVTDDPTQASAPVLKAKEVLYQSQWEAKLLSGVEDEEERHFCMLLDSLGASNVFEDPSEVRNLWTQLRRDEPHLLSNFEEFLARVTMQIKEAHQERKEMESALQKKAATHDSEIRYLYEEMEAQIKNEKERLLMMDSERLQLRSQDLEHKLLSKERELDYLFQKQKRLELQCHELSSEKQESHVENVKLKTTNHELSRALECTSQELTLAQEQLAMLQEQARRLQQEKEMEMYRVTEGLQREKQSLLRQLDLLREMNKHLKDERDMFCEMPGATTKKNQKADLSDVFDHATQAERSDDNTLNSPSAASDRTPTSQQRSPLKKTFTVPNGDGSPAQFRARETKAKSKMTPCRTPVPSALLGRSGGTSRGTAGSVRMDQSGLDTPPSGWPLRRVISIEEDHLPHLLHGGPQSLLQLSEAEEAEDDSGEEVEEEEEVMQSLPKPLVVMETSATYLRPTVKPGQAVSMMKSRSGKKPPVSPRQQPVGKESQQRSKETAVSAPDRLFKVVLVGNSSVGKTSLLRSFCEGRFHPATIATVGIDYSVKTLTLDGMQIAMQLWDTAGQERYRSITKQFFRKADGVVVMYDVTVEDSFKAVLPWFINVKEAAGEGVPILLLGSKMDMHGEREVSYKAAERLANENQVLFYEVSAYTGKNVIESLTHLARVLLEQEDRVRDTTVILSAQPIKKKTCCK